jgi:hypothetical protein
VHPRQIGFQGQHRGGAHLGIRQASDGEHGLRMLQERLTRLGEIRIVVHQIIVAIGQAQAALGKAHDDLFRVLVVGRDITAKGLVHAPSIGLADGRQQIGLAVDGGDFGQQWLHRGQALGLDPGFIHERRIEIADLAGDTARGSAGVRRSRFDDGTHLRAGLFVHVHCDADIGFVGRELGAAGPATVDELVEIVARFDAAVHPGEIDAETADCRLALCRQRRGRQHGNGKGHQANGQQIFAHALCSITA